MYLLAYKILLSSFKFNVENYSGIALILPYLFMRTVQKTRANFSANQILNYNQSRLGRPNFPALRAVACFYFEFSLAPWDSFFFCDWLLRLLWSWFYDARSNWKWNTCFQSPLPSQCSLISWTIADIISWPLLDVSAMASFLTCWTVDANPGITVGTPHGGGSSVFRIIAPLFRMG